ncbi:uncharacterized protein LOC131604259 [Vicia villosa]|uniref:uncharacterized protein LOC131604259 n=1 Tax=Vicia villosa TaxID=3911 RepID=UPI00273B109A|nr:uncharacterized protein LOC131604259 [Vicia villosa]
MALNDRQGNHDRTVRDKKAGILELNNSDALLAQNKLLTSLVELLTQQMSKLPQQLKELNGVSNSYQVAKYDTEEKAEKHDGEDEEYEIIDTNAEEENVNKEVKKKEKLKRNSSREKMASNVIPSQHLPYPHAPSKKDNARQYPSAIISRLPQKARDPGRVSLPVTIGNQNIGNGLINLGSSINLIPLSIVKRLGNIEMKSTRMTLQLADKSTTLPCGVAQDMLLRVQDEEVCFNLFDAMKQPKDKNDCFRMDVSEESVVEVANQIHLSSPLERSLVESFNYVFLDEEGNKPVVISSKLTTKEEARLIQILQKNKAAIGWVLADLKGISPAYCMHKIMLEEEFKPVAQPQRRLNPTMKEVVRKEVIKLLEAGMIYPISDSAWVSPVHVVPKKGGMTVIQNDKNELIPIRIVTGWRMCIDYRRLNKATRKDHFPLPFMDQMLERLSGQNYYCFLDGRMPFGLCNAPATFQRCMQAIFSDLIEKSIEVFMDDFSVFGKTFDTRLNNLDVALGRCIETNLILN